MKTGKFSIRARLQSFRHAFRGFRWLFGEEPNAWIHLAVTVVLVPVCFLLKLSLIEWAIIVICIGLVFSLELLNSAIERMCDKISPERDPQIGKIKDIAAAAVLIGAIVSAVVGLIILLPKILKLLNP
jgi:diacylglycerol kinase